MNSLYTNEVRQYIATRTWPKGLVFDVREEFVKDDQGNFLDVTHSQYLQFIFYRTNFNEFTGEQRLQIANVVNEVMSKLRKDGIPCYLEVKA